MKVYKEAHRVLKSNGRLVIGEYLLKESPLTPQEKSIIKPWQDGWAMPVLLTPGEYKKYLTDAGFSNINLIDITKFTVPSIKRLDVLSTLGLPVARGLEKLSIINKARYSNVEASYYQTKALWEGLWNYFVITAEK